MLKLSDSLTNVPVLSLQTGTPVATAVEPIINPNNLKVEGFYCNERASKKQMVLLCQDIRDMLDQGFVVNSHEVLADPADLVRLRNILELDFQLLGKPVYTISKDKIGKVGDYATDVSSMYVQKLYVAQSVLKSFTTGSLSVDRSQINEITNRRIIINDILKGTPASATAAA